MARLFLTQREFDLFSVNYQKTDKDDLYQEAIQKSFDRPIYLPAVVEYEGTTKAEISSMGLSKSQTLKVHLHKRDMDEKGIMPKEGDYIQFGEVNFEITFVNKPQIQYGHSERAYWYELTCSQADEGVFVSPELYPPINLEHAAVPGYFTQMRGEPTHDQRALQEGPVGLPITGVKSSPFDDDINDDS